MRSMTSLGLLVAALSFLPSAPVQAQQSMQGSHQIMNPSDLSWAPAPSLPACAQLAVIEGPLDKAMPFTARVKFSGNCQIAAHSHPGTEHVTVLQGALHLGMGDKLDESKGTALQAGSVAIMPPNMNHFAWASGDTIIQLHGVGPWGINYVNPNDDPRKKSTVGQQ